MNGLSIQIFDQIPAAPKHELKWRKCEVTNVYQVSIMNLKIEVTAGEKFVELEGEFFSTGFEGWVRTPMTNWQYLGDGFTSLESLKENALLNVSKQLRALAHHVASMSNFEQL